MAKIPLNAARAALGWTQEQLADKMGVSRQLVIEWESGKREMKTVYFHAFCQVTGFSEDDILLPIKST